MSALQGEPEAALWHYFQELSRSEIDKELLSRSS
jgi:hypothetical protein